MSEKVNGDNPNEEEWDGEAEQNWANFWNLLLQEGRKQNENLYKKNRHKEVKGREILKKLKQKKQNEKPTN